MPQRTIYEKLRDVVDLPQFRGDYKELASRIGVSKPTVWRWLNEVKARGKRSRPSAEQLLRVMLAAEKPLDWWLKPYGQPPILGEPVRVVTENAFQAFLQAVGALQKACRPHRSRLGNLG